MINLCIVLTTNLEEGSASIRILVEKINQSINLTFGFQIF